MRVSQSITIEMRFGSEFAYKSLLNYGIMYSLIWSFGCVVVFLSNTITSENTAHLGEKSLLRDFQNDLFFARFYVERRRYLNVTAITITSVERAGVCGYHCAETHQCFSFNLASTPDADGKRVCQLLPTDKFNSSDRLQTSEDFHHYSIQVSKIRKSRRNSYRPARPLIQSLCV